MFVLEKQIFRGSQIENYIDLERLQGEDMNLKTGTYYAAGSAHASSYRVIANQGSRTCIKIVNGPSNPNEGFQHITVSSVSSSDGKLLIDATDEEILINAKPKLVANKGRFHFTIGGPESRSGVWEHMKDDFEPDTAIDECLSSTGKYEKTWQGQLITGLVVPEKKGHLTAQNAGFTDQRSDRSRDEF